MILDTIALADTAERLLERDKRNPFSVPSEQLLLAKRLLYDLARVKFCLAALDPPRRL